MGYLVMVNVFKVVHQINSYRDHNVLIVLHNVQVVNQIVINVQNVRMLTYSHYLQQAIFQLVVFQDVSWAIIYRILNVYHAKIIALNV